MARARAAIRRYGDTARDRFSLLACTSRAIRRWRHRARQPRARFLLPLALARARRGADLRAEYCGNTPLDVASAGVRTACSEASRARYETLRELIADKVKPKKKPRMKKKPGDDI